MLDFVYFIIFFINIGGMLIITLVIAALTLIERKFLALNQRRVGPYYVGYHGRLQYIADALKLFIKGVVIYDESNKFWFVAVPSICALVCYFFWVNSVWCPSVSIVDIEYNLVYATLLSISFSFCIILLGYFSGNKYTKLASIRCSLIVLNLELFLGLMILTTVVVTESFCFSVFVEYQKFWWLIFTYFGLAGLLCLVFLLEVGRTPFDLAEAESELVTGYSTEIGGFTFGIFYLGEYFHLFFFSAVMSIIFLGGWEYPNFLGYIYITDYVFYLEFFNLLDYFDYIIAIDSSLWFIDVLLNKFYIYYIILYDAYITGPYLVMSYIDRYLWFIDALVYIEYRYNFKYYYYYMCSIIDIPLTFVYPYLFLLYDSCENVYFESAFYIVFIIEYTIDLIFSITYSIVFYIFISCNFAILDVPHDYFDMFLEYIIDEINSSLFYCDVDFLAGLIFNNDILDYILDCILEYIVPDIFGDNFIDYIFIFYSPLILLLDILYWVTPDLVYSIIINYHVNYLDYYESFGFLYSEHPKLFSCN
jgi:NADH-quinone oxidoreductase subunit H